MDTVEGQVALIAESGCEQKWSGTKALTPTPFLEGERSLKCFSRSVTLVMPIASGV